MAGKKILRNTAVNERVYNKEYVDYLESLIVKLSGNQTISDIKTFGSSPIVPVPTEPEHAVNKEYADSYIEDIEVILASLEKAGIPLVAPIIESVNISVNAPVNGTMPGTRITINDFKPKYTSNSASWDPIEIVNGTKAYTASFVLIPSRLYVFADDLEVNVNGQLVSSESNEDGSWSITVRFTQTMTALPQPSLTISRPYLGGNRPTTVAGSNFSGTIEWSPPGQTFPEGVSTGTFTLNANSGYRWNGNGNAVAVTLNGTNHNGVLNADGTQITFAYATTTSDLLESVSLSVVEPVNGQSLNNNVTINDANPNYSVSAAAWQPSGTVNGTNAHTATFTITPIGSFVFANPISISLNGGAPTSAVPNPDGSVTITKTFPASLIALPVPSIAITPERGANRPATVSGTNFSGTISWSPAGATFPEGVSTGTFTLTASEGYRWNSDTVTLNGANYEGRLNSTGTILTFAAGLDSVFIDPRDNKMYRTVKIGNQTWLAENLNYSGNNNNVGVYYNDTGTTVPGNNEPFPKAGRLYTHAEALTIAPPGWHLPTDAEWEELITSIGGITGGGAKLKSRNSEQPPNAAWNANGGNLGDGTDDFKFAGLPTGSRSTNSLFSGVGTFGRWWSSTDDNSNSAFARVVNYNSADVSRSSTNKVASYSVRCVMN